MEGKNYIFSSFLFVFTLALLFGLLSFLDYNTTIFRFELKPINMFSDIIADEDTVIEPVEIVKIPKIDSVSYPQGLTPIQNFTTQKFPLDPIFSKLQRSKRGRDKVRIAWFGDSFTDADLVVCDLRDSLQSVFGGNGVGFVPMTHEAAGYRRSVQHSFGGWQTSSVIVRKGVRNFGINGFNYRPDSANYVRFKSSYKYKHTRKFDVFRLFYSAQSESEARLALNDTIKKRITLNQTSLPEMLTVASSDIQKVKLNFNRQSGVTIYGASLEDSTGIYVDNFSIKGNSGLSLLAIPTANLMKFDSLLNYDMIVLQFGLNAMTPESRKYTDYMEGMKKLILKFKAAFPNTPILMLSVSDRSERRQGNFSTMKAVKSLVNVQEQFAFDNKLLFWNLYEAMGGENSMSKLVHSNPPLAAKDYTHLNFDGGRIIGHKLAGSFIFESQQFVERRKNLVAN
ncbi:MAG: hypothetical protein ACOYM7_12925 [Paludibacter sp.]